MLADDDGLVAGALAIDVGVDFCERVADLLDLQHLYAHAVRNFIAQIAQRLFADDLGTHYALGLVGDHVVREVLRPLGHGVDQQPQQLVHIFAGACGDRCDGVKAAVIQRSELGHQLLGRDKVDLVDGKKFGTAHPG